MPASGPKLGGITGRGTNGRSAAERRNPDRLRRVDRSHRREPRRRRARAGRDAAADRSLPAGRGPPDHRGPAGSGQNDARESVGPVDRLLLLASAVHARPAPVGCDRRQRLQPAFERVRVPAGPGLRQPAARRRDQPGVAENPGGAARVHAGGPGHGRWPFLRASAAVHGDRHSEPRRVRGHVSTAGGPARPVHDSACDRLSATVRRGADADRADRRSAAGDPRTRGDGRRGHRADRPGSLDLRRGEPQPVRRRAAAADPPGRAPLRGREPARRDRAAAGRQGEGARRRAGVRRARRRQGGRRTCARAPADARSRGALRRRHSRRARPRRARAHARPRMTARGRALLGLGLLTYAAARAFGSKPLYPVALGLLFAVALAWLWVRLAQGPMRLHREVGAEERLEGDDVEVELRLEHAATVPPASLVLVERLSGLGERRTPLDSRRGRYTLSAVRRGRYLFLEVRAVLEDAFGLQRAEIPLAAPWTLLVYPRLVELERLFSEGGTYAQDGRRLLLRRPSGFDLHSVRDYEQGESLRKVHWRSTAKRGELMVKELEDAPRDEVAILLDGEASAVVGKSFDVQVRVAGSLLLAQARRGRRAVLLVNGAHRTVQRVHSYETDWQQAYDLLAAAEADGHAPAGALLGDEGSAGTRALELTVVTASLSAMLVERLLQRTLGQRRAALVYVDPASFGANGAHSAPQPALLRLQAGGVPVAVIRRGDDLVTRLGTRGVGDSVRGGVA